MSHSIESTFQSLRALGPVTDPDGGEVAVRFLKAASEEELQRFDMACGGTTPSALRRFLRQSRGVFCGELTFAPEPESTAAFGFERLIPTSDNGSGDGFFIEVDQGRSRVWWLGHDSWFIVYWGTLEEFLPLLLKQARRHLGGFADELWAPATTAREPKHFDAELRDFVNRQPKGSVIRDLRGATPGTQLDYECLAAGGAIHRRDLLFAFAPVKDVGRELRWFRVEHYLATASDDERKILARLPSGCAVVHERDIPPGQRLDPFAFPERDMTRRPPFHVLLPGPGGAELASSAGEDSVPLIKPWWRFWG